MITTIVRSDHGSREENHDDRGYVTHGTHGTDVTHVPTTSDGAAVFSAGSVVGEYVKARAAHGLGTTVRERGVMGRYARELIQVTSWSPELIIESVQRFAATRRHPRFLAEWVATVFNAQSLAEHKASHDDAPMSAEVMAAITGGLKRMPVILEKE